MASFSFESLRPDEQNFYDHVMRGSETMLPNPDAQITLYDVETPLRSAHAFRRLGVSGLDLAAPTTLDLRFRKRDQAFVVERLGLGLSNGNRLRLSRGKEGFKPDATEANKQTIQRTADVLDPSEVELALMDFELPPLAPPQDDPVAYQMWLNQMRDRAQSWSTRERATLRKGRAGLISARLSAIRQENLYPNTEFSGIRGVEYRIEDLTESGVSTVHTSFVGEHTESDNTEFGSYMEKTVRHRGSRQVQRFPRQPIVLTPHHRAEWLEKLVDEKTDTPFIDLD